VLPEAYEPAAVVLLILGGAVACFAGYRLFRVVLAIYGFIFGAMMASSMMGATNTVGMVVAAIVGGIVGALILVFAYFVGVALLGAGVGALVAHVGWTQTAGTDPPAVAVILLSIVGAVIALLLQRYVLILGTAFAGAWTLLVGVLTLTRDRAATRAGATAHVWILYPFGPAPGQRWLPIAWVALGVLGTAVQLGLSGRRR
jgi:hypothetical protein